MINLSLSEEVAGVLLDYLGDRTQDEIKNWSQNLTNNFDDDAEEDYKQIRSLVSCILKLEDVLQTTYSSYLMPWENQDHEIYPKLQDDLKEEYDL